MLQQEAARCKKGRDKKGAADAVAKARSTVLIPWTLVLEMHFWTFTADWVLK